MALVVKVSLVVAVDVAAKAALISWLVFVSALVAALVAQASLVALVVPAV